MGGDRRQKRDAAGGAGDDAPGLLIQRRDEIAFGKAHTIGGIDDVSLMLGQTRQAPSGVGPAGIKAFKALEHPFGGGGIIGGKRMGGVGL